MPVRDQALPEVFVVSSERYPCNLVKSVVNTDAGSVRPSGCTLYCVVVAPRREGKSTTSISCSCAGLHDASYPVLLAC